MIPSFSRIIDLEQPRFPGMPIHPAHKPGYFYALHRRHSDPTGSPRTSAAGMLTMMEHTGTHIDALSHQAAHGCLHGGVPAHSVESPQGFSSHGVETIPPLVRRAVFADLSPLPPRHQFTASDLEAALGPVRPNPGDVLLVRTGFDRLWQDEPAYLDAAGAHKSATLWAADHQVSAVGADNMAWDLPGVTDPDTGVTLFAHFFLLPQKGIYIIENLNLAELAAAHVRECLFVCLPLKLNGATGSPVRPIALL
ncbi:MAG: cyclase family protein [Acidobacteriota bacterium]